MRRVLAIMAVNVRRMLAIMAVNVRRMLRERSNVFFVFIFPLLLVLLIGLAFGGGVGTRVAVHVADDGDPLARRLMGAVEQVDGVTVDRYDGQPRVVEAVRSGSAAGGLVVPAGYDAAVAGGDDVVVTTLAAPDRQDVRALLDAAVSEQSTTLAAARAVAEATGVPFAAAAEQVEVAALPGIGVEVTATDPGVVADAFEGLGRFDLGASSNLLLFVFLTSLAGSAALIQSRQLGLTRRMLATPASVTQILAGEAAGRFAVAMVQGVYIIVGTLVAFGVDWGAPLGALAVLVLFSAVGTGAAMLVGALFSNDQQAAGIGVMVGLGFAALGGTMFPLDLFPPTLRQVAHVTPHAWAYDAFAELVRRDGSVVDILPELGVLAAYAAVLLAAATWALHRVSVRA